MHNDEFEQHIPSTQVAEREPETALAPPPLFEVILHNDDYTPMDFVVAVLKQFFNLDEEQATTIMYQVHTEGKAACGVFTHDVAETKVSQVTESARKHSYPLLCTLEKITE